MRMQLSFTCRYNQVLEFVYLLSHVIKISLILRHPTSIAAPFFLSLYAVINLRCLRISLQKKSLQSYQYYSLLTIILIPTITLSIGILIIAMIIIILILTLQLLLLPIIIIHSYMHTTCEVMTMKGQLDQIKINGLSELCTLYVL